MGKFYPRPIMGWTKKDILIYINKEIDFYNEEKDEDEVEIKRLTRKDLGDKVAQAFVNKWYSAFNEYINNNGLKWDFADSEEYANVIIPFIKSKLNKN